MPVGQPGSYVAITAGDIRILAMISAIAESEKSAPASNLTGKSNDKQVTINLVPLGEVNSAGVFESGVRNFPVSGSPVHPVTEDDIKSIFVKFRSQGYSVGKLSSHSDLDVCFDPAALFGRHCAILGQSGAGKSWTVTNPMQRAVKVMPKAHIVMLDLHGAPGGQSTSWHQGLTDGGHLWTEERCIAKTERLWQALASYFADDPHVAVYDLLNEPLEDSAGEGLADWQELAERAARAIRKIDGERAISRRRASTKSRSATGSPSGREAKNSVGW